MSAIATIQAVIRRDLTRAVRQKSRVVGGLARPFMWLLLVGAGYNAIARVEGAPSYQAYVLPGLVVMSALFGSMLTAISTVYDREFGVLRLMLASPSGVPALLAGRAFASTVIGALQGLIVLLFAPVFLSIGFTEAIVSLGVLVLNAFVFSLVGLLVAAPIRSLENFAGIINVVLFPLLFLSGALYPTSNMPGPLSGLAALNPVSYAVDLARGALGQPVEFSTSRSLLVLAVTAAAAFVGAALLFDPERRMRRPAPR
jgi:ABC-2 type transport system permease protein